MYHQNSFLLLAYIYPSLMVLIREIIKLHVQVYLEVYLLCAFFLYINIANLIDSNIFKMWVIKQWVKSTTEVNSRGKETITN